MMRVEEWYQMQIVSNSNGVNFNESMETFYYLFRVFQTPTE